MKHSQVDAGPVELHVVEHGEGPPVLLVHGFPDLWRGWRLQMEALAEAGHRAIALDMRGYGRSSAPEAEDVYTQLQTVGDLVGVLDALGIPAATVVGHDFGANVAWHAALLRPDRFPAVFGASVPYRPRGDASLLDAMRAAGKDGFYMFDQRRPEADRAWADAGQTLPRMYHWTSGSPAPDERWDPFDKRRSFLRPVPAAAPAWADPDDMAYAVAEFRRTGFRGGLNYYRSIEPAFALLAPFKGAVVRQPSFFLVGEVDGLNRVGPPTTEEGLRTALPGLRGFVSLPGVGHWPQREAPDAFNRALLGFLGGLR